MWISKWGQMAKWEPQHDYTWISVNIKSRYMTKCEYKHGDTWPSENTNTGTYYQMWLSITGSNTKCDHQHWDTWPMSTSPWGHIAKWEYPHGDTWSSTNVNMETCDQVKISRVAYMTKWQCHYGYTLPIANSNRSYQCPYGITNNGILDQIWN